MTKHNNTPYKSSPLTKEPLTDAPDERVPGLDTKKARGLDKNVGKSLNEAGTDQKVEDAKKARQK